MNLKMTMDFILEVLRIFKPDQRKWVVRILLLAGIPMVAAPFWQPWIQAILIKYIPVDLPDTSITGWILIIIGLVFHIFNLWQEKQLRKDPTFREEHDSLVLTLGGGMECVYSKEQLREQSHHPFNLCGYVPIELYVEGRKLYADVEIFSQPGLPSIKIKKNTLSDLPNSWDCNKNQHALEIVNEKGIPIYQFIYKRDGHISLCGIFPFPGGLILADDNHMVINPSLPTRLSLKKIFKYPSWKYPAEYET